MVKLDVDSLVVVRLSFVAYRLRKDDYQGTGPQIVVWRGAQAGTGLENIGRDATGTK